MSQLLTLIQDSHNKVNSLSDARDFHDPETASISWSVHVPSQPLTIPSPRGMPSRDSGLPLDTRSTSGTSRKVVESLPRDDHPLLSSASSSRGLRPDIAGNTLEHEKSGEKGAAEFVSTCTTFQTGSGNLNHTGGTHSQHGILEKIPRLQRISKL